MQDTAQRTTQKRFPVFWFQNFSHKVMIEQIFGPEEAVNKAAWKDKDPAGILIVPNTSIERIENTSEGQKKVIRDAYDVMLDGRFKTDEERQQVVDRLMANEGSYPSKYQIHEPQKELVVTTQEEIDARVIALARKMVEGKRPEKETEKPAG